jgi:hypothetical protein
MQRRTPFRSDVGRRAVHLGRYQPFFSVDSIGRGGRSVRPSFGFGEITLWIRTEQPIIGGDCSKPGATPTDPAVSAVVTVAGQIRRSPANGLKKRIRVILPDVGEGPIPNVTETVGAPKLRRMNVSETVDSGDTLAGRIAAIPFEPIVDPMCRFLAEFSASILDDVGRIGVIADQKRLDFLAGPIGFDRPIADPFDDRTTFLGIEIDRTDRFTPSAVGEMIKAEPIETDIAQQIDDAVEISNVLSGDGVSQPRLEPDVETGFDPFDSRLKRSVDAPEIVVSFGEAVDGHAGVRQAGILQLAGTIGRQERSVRREHWSDPDFGGVGNEISEILTNQRFATGK